MKILGVERYRITMRNTIQPREYSRGGGKEGTLHIMAAFNRWNDERNVNVNKNDNNWNDNWRFAGVRKSTHFSPALAGEFCLVS